MSNKLFIGVDLGGTTTKLAIINYYGEILYKWEIDTDVSNGGKHIITNIAKTIDKTLEDKGFNKEDVIGVGMGAPGPVNLDTGVIYEAVNLGWESNFPLKDLLELETSLSAVVDNDANCAALGEMWKGAGDGAKDLICITLGTGVGGGVIANGDIVHGIHGAAGEIGHFTSIPTGGAPCNCGKTGCLETIASATGIVRIATERLAEAEQNSELADLLKQNGKINAKNVFDCARNGDQVAIHVIEEVAFHLGLALANVANTLNPEKIVLGGGVSRAGDLLLSKLKTNFQRYAFPRVAKSTELALATLGNDAGVIGAAWLTKNKIVK